MKMFELFYASLAMSVIVAVIGVGMSILWRTSIYTRGGIFRPLGRVLDYWVHKGCLPTATWKDKILRFLSYPLGRCIYCSSFHITYDVYFLMAWAFDLPLEVKWLLIILPLSHLFVIMYMKWFINGNDDLAKSDWYYMKKQIGVFIDRPLTIKQLVNEYDTDEFIRECDKALEEIKG